MHVTKTAANCPVRERQNLFHLYGVWLENKAGPPKGHTLTSHNLPKQICRHQCSSPMFPYKSNLRRPEFYFVTVLYSLSVDFRIVLRMHFTFCNFLLPSPSRSIESDEKKRWLCIRRSSIVLQGEKSGPWRSSPHHSAMKILHVSSLLLLQPKISKCNFELEQKLCSTFGTETRTCPDRTLAALPHYYVVWSTGLWIIQFFCISSHLARYSFTCNTTLKVRPRTRAHMRCLYLCLLWEACDTPLVHITAMQHTSVNVS